jgi:hypothetical protein
MNRRKAAFVVAAAFALSSVFAWAATVVFARSSLLPDVREQLVGSWSLASRVTTLGNGEVMKDPGLASTPNGLLIYDRTGHVAAQLSRQGRTVEMIAGECAEAAKIRGTNDTAQTVLGYDAYFGTFTVNEKEGYVVHHVESALFPGDVGKDIRRNFVIAGDKLTLEFNTTTPTGTPITRTLVWERMK